MNLFHNPDWVLLQTSGNATLADVPQQFFDKINEGLIRLSKNDAPIVSIVIPVWNEELNIVKTLFSLSQNVTTHTTEIIVVNNNSKDRTEEVLSKFKIKSFFQGVQGCGPARQLGQELASGKYILMADADCFYPTTWIQTMIDKLQPNEVSCVYGRHSFIANSRLQRFNFFLYEILRDFLIELRHFKRPYLNALGMCMAYKKEFGLKAGFDMRNVRGEDGRLCFDLMQYGKIEKIPRSLRVWTPPRTIGKERGILFSLSRRLLIEFSRFHEFFYKKQTHDTHASKNYSLFKFRWPTKNKK